MLIDQKSYVIEKVDATAYYQSRFPKWNPRVKANVVCVFHKGDKKPSLSINLRNGGARCFASSCGKSIGNIVHFEAQYRGIDEETAARNLYSEFIRPIVPVATLQQFRDGFTHDPKQRAFFTRATGINPATIDKFGIGYDTRTKRFTFPIQNQFGDVVNVRFYRPKSARSPKDIKIYSLVEGKGTDAEIRYGGIELFAWQTFRTYTTAKPLFLMASEKETMLASQLNLQAVCSTNGEGSWSDEWLELFAGYEIGVLFDQDKGGQKGAIKIVATLQQQTKSVVALKLPFANDYRGDTDFDDWILSKNGNQFALVNLLKDSLEAKKAAEEKKSLAPVETRRAKVAGDEWDVPKFFDEEQHDLGEIRTRTDILNHCIYTRGIIAAVSSKSFDVPYKFKLKTKNGIQDYSVPIGRDLVSFVGASDSDILATLSRIIGATVLEWRAEAHIPIAEVEIVPIVDVGTDAEGRYTVQRCFVLGRSIESNTPYNLVVVPTTLSRSQEKVCIIVSAEETSRMLDIQYNEKELATFKTFQPADGQTVSQKLEQIADEIANNHSKIYSRTDWHIVALLTWVSPLAWNFPGQAELQRGWLNALAIGDTQTGKSKVVETLQRLFRLGDIVNAENCTFVGLVGGAIKTGSGQMMLRWGRIPLCDKKLVIIEELSGLSITEISNMSEVRSRGIARLDKGGLASQTPARTRLLALSNVRPMQRNLAQYLSGVKAIQELIGHPEDISRFDLIATLVDSEVSSDVINSPTDETTEATFTPEQLHKLCQFAWSLKPNQIKFSDDAYLSCLQWTQKLQEIYHPSVPIFKAASGRLLLARIGASIATLQFSWDGETLTVEEAHIEAAVDLLRSLYDKPSFGYLEYSRQMQDREAVKANADLDKAVRQNIKGELLVPVLENLIHAAKFTRDELAATGGMQLFQADDLLGAFLRSRVIRKGEANTWEITKPGKGWMADQINGTKPKDDTKETRKSRVRKV
jgi:hypothetical protein